MTGKVIPIEAFLSPIARINDTTLPEAARIAEGWIRTNIPDIFPSDPCPLAVGIFDQLLSLSRPPHVYASGIKQFLKDLTNSKAYLYAVLKDGAMRVDIYGNLSAITQEEKAYTQQLLEG